MYTLNSLPRGVCGFEFSKQGACEFVSWWQGAKYFSFLDILPTLSFLNNEWSLSN